MSYFVDGLNYSLSNEDTRVEQGLMAEGLESVFAIGGSGARVMPLIAKNPRTLKVIDLSDLQLKLVELRLVAARTLSYDEYLFLLGYRGGLPGGKTEGDDRHELFERLPLATGTKEFWRAQKLNWQPHGFIYLGRWERHFLKISRAFDIVLRLPMDKIFAAQSLEEQQELFKKHFKPLVFRSFLRVVASEFVFDKFLYKGHFSGKEGRRSDPRPPWKMVDEEFTRIFQTQLLRKNYFFQMLFLGRLMFEEGLPLEAQAATVAGVRAAKTEVTFHATNLLQGLALANWNFVSLSDTISYLSDEEMKQMYQHLSDKCQKGTKVVIRSFLRGSEMPNLPGWQRLETAESAAVALDGTGVYQFQILQKI